MNTILKDRIGEKEKTIVIENYFRDGKNNFANNKRNHRNYEELILQRMFYGAKM